MSQAQEIIARHWDAIADELSLEDVEFLTPEIDEIDKPFEALMRKLCARDGHSVQDDHCGKPEHRYCRFCKELTPHAPIA